ncbi:MAG: tRNA pseudouridine(38-40) synthase TruA [Clostridia bacterium]|nr:tRNA pseudouridine(38-40) synthase TruA [Clostridia bacterium]
MRNFKLTIEYDGANFFGWQKQAGRRTVQGEIEKAISTMTDEEVTLEGSGRTDRGVHALGQVANFKMENPIPAKKIKGVLNNLLPADIRILKVEEVEISFHARFACKRKTYRYVVQVGGQRSALDCQFLAFFPYSVDLQKMTDAAKLLIGKHNFKGFCSADTNVTNFEREIFDISIKKVGKKFAFEVTGSGFLYNMVRIIVGTLLDVGRGMLTCEDVKKALDTGERKHAGKTMEACGLYLKKVEYC